MNKKDKELLMELMPIIIKYDLATIEHCIDYIMENKEKLSACLSFVNGNHAEVRKGKSKNETDEFLLTIDKEKSLVIKRICRYLSGKNFTVEQIQRIFRQYFESNQISEEIHSNEKEGISLEVAQFLANLDMQEIIEVERFIQMGKLVKNENSLENWSKLIVKE